MAQNTTPFMDLNVLVVEILPYLPLRDLFLLACVNSYTKDIVHGYLKKLRIVDLGKERFTKQAAIDHLSHEVARAEKLIFRHCANVITPQVLSSFIDNNKDSLVLVDLTGCQSLDDNSMIKLGECRKLTHLSLQGCQWSVDAVVTIVEMCPPLQILDLTRTTFQVHEPLTDFHIGRIAANCPK